MICKFALPLLSLITANTVTHCYDTSAVLPELLLAKSKQKAARLFSSLKIIFASPCAKISCSNFLVEEKFQASPQTTFDIVLNQIPLNFLLPVSFNFRGVVQTLNKLRKLILKFWEEM